MAPPVPEILLKKRKQVEEARVHKAALAGEGKHKKRRTQDFKRAEVFVEEFRAKEADLRRLKQEAMLLNRSGFEISDDKLIFAVRHGGIPPKMHALSRRALDQLRLSQLYTGVFLKANAPNIKLLRLVSPYVAYGSPSVKSVKDLVYKRGFCNVNEGRSPLTSNDVVEEALGEHNIICIEDLVHEIVSVGPNFSRAAQFLWPFKMKAPTVHGVEGRLRQKKRGHVGNVDDRIDKMIIGMI